MSESGQAGSASCEPADPVLVRLCKWLGLHVHDWTQWQESGRIVSTIHKGVIGSAQRRKCKTCGKIQSSNIWMG